MRVTILFLLISFLVKSQEELIKVSDLNFKLTALTEQTYSYGFAKGDKVILNYSEERGKKLKSFELYTQSGSKILSEFNLTTLKDESITIKSTGIYTFKFVNNALGRRIIHFSVSRIPESQATAHFNTEVHRRTIVDTTYTTKIESYIKSENYKVVEVASDQQFFINSGANASLLGGKSRVIIPVTLPTNTVKWYYQVAASRDSNHIDNIKEKFSLVSDLSKLIDQSGSVGFAIDLISMPPGADFCDVYLIDQNQYSNFLNKVEFRHYPIGTRENIKSANVEIEGKINQPLYLGLKNPDNMYGVNVLIKIAAIVREQEMATREIQVPQIKSRIELYLDESED